MIKSEESVTRIENNYTVDYLEQKDEQVVIDMLTKTFTESTPIF